MSDRTHAGDANRITRDYLDSLLIEMRHIGAVLPDTRLSLFGHLFSTPISTAALSHLQGKDGNGMVQMAQACADTNAPCFAGMGDEEELAQMLSTGAKVIKIIKPYADREMIHRRIEHAKQAGVLALGMDLDHSFNHKGEHDVVLGIPMAPMSEAELRALIHTAKLPFVIKGVLSVTDALKAQELGAAGIVVSHHHGILPYAIPPLLVLPDIVKAVGGTLKIFVDCGLHDGYDAFKALALGADAACLGRVIMPPMQTEGAAGAAAVITRANEELRGAMARTACGTLADINPGLIWRI